MNLLLDCGHAPDGSTDLVCSHLLDLRGTDDADFVKVFTGHGKTYRLACNACADLPFDTVPWRSACAACFILLDDEVFWDGVRGTPQVIEAPVPLHFVHRQFAAPSEAVWQIEPVPGASGSTWVALMDSGALVELTFTASGIVARQEIVQLTASEVDIHPFLTLRCSTNGRFIAVGDHRSDRAVVYDRQAGQFTLRIQSDRYRSSHTLFSLAFVHEGSRALLVHKSAWNRLDISDPETGACLTERTLIQQEEGAPRPAHYLDYFHGSLAVAPDQNFIADNGWVWSTAGVLRTWSTRRWREENVWESEDGPTLKRLTQRWDLWSGPLCWIDNHTLAVWGYGRDDYWMIPAVSLYDVVSGDLTHWFPGPEVGAKKPTPAWAITSPTQETDWSIDGALYFDRYLFSTSRHHGISMWDITTGTRLHQDASFAPHAYHPTTREFLTLLPDNRFQLSLLTEANLAAVP